MTATGGVSQLRPMLVALAIMAAPLAFLVAIRVSTAGDLSGIDVDVAPVVVPAAARSIDERTTEEVTLVWGESTSLLAPAWFGTVTAVHAAAGDTIGAETAVLVIDGIDRTAYPSEQPFYRAVAFGDTGPDVANLNLMLVALGYMDALPADPTSFASSTTAAVREFESALGMETPTGRFDPALVIWLSQDSMLLAEVALTVAAPAPAPGQPFATSRANLRSAAIGSQNPARPLSLDPEATYTLTIQGVEFSLQSESATVAEGELARLAELALGMPPQGQGPFGGPASTGPVESLSGLSRRSVALEAVSIPATAVVTNAAGDLCVWRRSAEVAFEAVRVVVQSSLSGVTNVVGGLAVADDVLANPRDVLRDFSCP